MNIKDTLCTTKAKLLYEIINMKYTVDEVNHILYHNRSVELVKKFLPTFDLNNLLHKENMLMYCRGLYTKDSTESTEFEISDFDMNVSDIIFEKSDIENLTEQFKKLTVHESDVEYDYIVKRNLKPLINKYNIITLSSITDENTLDIIGATTHPLLNNVLGDGISGGGVVFPLYEDDILVNVAIRRVDTSNKMKYGNAIPDISMWGLYDIEYNAEIWLTEGLIDRIFMLENGFDNVISASTPGLSIIHLLKILEKNPKAVNIWSDKDQTGLRHSAIIQKFMTLNSIPCEVYVSEESKDPDDHFNKDLLTLGDIYPIKISNEQILKYPININPNFLEYLKNRNI